MLGSFNVSIISVSPLQVHEKRSWVWALAHESFMHCCAYAGGSLSPDLAGLDCARRSVYCDRHMHPTISCSLSENYTENMTALTSSCRRHGSRKNRFEDISEARATDCCKTTAGARSTKRVPLYHPNSQKSQPHSSAGIIGTHLSCTGGKRRISIATTNDRHRLPSHNYPTSVSSFIL